MKKIEFAHELLSESRRSTQLYLESGRDYHKAKAHMYSIFECYAHGLIGWNQVRTRWHNSILEYLNLYADRPDLYLSESNRMLGEYESTLQTYKPALDEYKRVNEQKMTSNIVVKGKLNESQAKQQSNLYFNRRALNENQLTDTAGMKTWKQVQESYPNLTAKDELRVRMLTIYEGSTVDTTKLVTTYMSEEPTAISGPMQTSMRPRPRPATPNNLADVYPPRGDMEMDPANMAPTSKLAPTTSPRPVPRPAATQSIGAGSQVTRMPNGSVDGSTRGIDPADVYSPEDLAKLTGQPASRLAPTTSPRPLPRPATLKQSANNNIRKEAASIFNKIKLIANEGYKVLPPMNKERYTEIPGLEGPFTTLSGKVVYYDPKEGAYYDRDSDMYLSTDEYTALNSDYSGMKDERDIKIREAKKAKPGHNARVMARAQDTIRKSIEQSQKNVDKKNDEKEKVDEAGSYRDRGAQNMMKASRKADKEADKVRAQRDKDEAKKKKENVKESYKMTETTEEVDDFLRELNADDVGVSDVGAYRVHYEGFSDWCQSDAEERCSLPTNDPRHLNSYDDIYDEVLRDFIAREDGKQPIESGLTGDEDYPVFYAVFDREIVSEAVAKIACVKCDEVSTAAAWKKNNGFCPKCKTSNQGVAESVNQAASFKLKVTNPATSNSETQEFNSETALKDYAARAKQRGLKVSRIKPTNEADSAQDLAIQAIQSKLKKAKVSYRDPNAKTAREEDRIAKMLAAKAKKKNESIDEANTSYEKDMDHDKAVVISGVKGVKSTPFRKKFKNMAAYDKWSDSEEASNYEVQDVMNESKLTEGDIVDFGMFAGMYADGARTSFTDNEGKFRQVTATGGLPREYTLDGKTVSKEDLMRITKRARLGRFEPGMSESTNEAVTLDYSRYMRSHGKKPRDAGGGSSTWMFTTAEFGEPGEDEIFQFQGNFADAKKAAAKWAKSQGQYRVYAMEDAAPKVNEQQTITEAQFDEAAGEKDACYHKVKSRYKVWPSAYASGALSKCRKVGASNWGKSKE